MNQTGILMWLTQLLVTTWKPKMFSFAKYCQISRTEVVKSLILFLSSLGANKPKFLLVQPPRLQIKESLGSQIAGWGHCNTAHRCGGCWEQSSAVLSLCYSLLHPNLKCAHTVLVSIPQGVHSRVTEGTANTIKNHKSIWTDGTKEQWLKSLHLTFTKA